MAAMETRRGEDGRRDSQSQSGAEFGSGHGVWGARRRDDLLVGSMRARRQVGSGPKPNPLGAAVFSFLYFLKIKISKIYVRF